MRELSTANGEQVRQTFRESESMVRKTIDALKCGQRLAQQNRVQQIMGHPTIQPFSEK